jgi:exodeoxyribonuclease V alpha subunit
MQRPAETDQRRETASSDRPAAALAGIVERVLFERPETGYRVLRVRAVGERDPVVVVGNLPPAEPGELIRAQGGWYDD